LYHCVFYLPLSLSTVVSLCVLSSFKSFHCCIIVCSMFLSKSFHCCIIVCSR
jgi:hypothetical protein